MLVKKIIIASFVSSLVFSLTAMQKTVTKEAAMKEAAMKKAAMEKEIVEHRDSILDTCLALKVLNEEYAADSKAGLPKDITSRILLLRSEYIGELTIESWIGKLNDPTRIKRDLGGIITLADIVFLTKKEQDVFATINEKDRIALKNSNNYFTKKEYENSANGLPLSFIENKLGKNCNVYVPDTSQLVTQENKELIPISNSFSNVSFKESLIGGCLLGGGLYICATKAFRNFRAIVSPNELMASATMTAVCCGFVCFLQKLRVDDAEVPKKNTIAEFPNVKVRNFFDDKEFQLREQLLAEKKLENMHCKLLNKLQKNQMSKNLLLKKRE